MSWVQFVYILGELLWIAGVLKLSQGQPFYKTVIAGILGVVWPISAVALLIYIYAEREDNNA